MLTLVLYPSNSNDRLLQPPPKSRSVWRTPTPNKHEHSPKQQQIATNERPAIARHQHEYQNSYARNSTPSKYEHQLRGQDVSSNERKASGRSQHEYEDNNAYRNRATRSDLKTYYSQMSSLSTLQH